MAHSVSLHWLLIAERGRQSDRNAAGIPRNSPPAVDQVFLMIPCGIFNMEHNRTGSYSPTQCKETLPQRQKCQDHRLRPWKQSVRKLRQVPTSWENILQQGTVGVLPLTTGGPKNSKQGNKAIKASCNYSRVIQNSMPYLITDENALLYHS